MVLLLAYYSDPAEHRTLTLVPHFFSNERDGRLSESLTYFSFSNAKYHRSINKPTDGVSYNAPQISHSTQILKSNKNRKSIDGSTALNADENKTAIKKRQKKCKPLIYHYRFIEHKHICSCRKSQKAAATGEFIPYPVYDIDNRNAQRSKIYPKNLDFIFFFSFSVLINSAVLKITSSLVGTKSGQIQFVPLIWCRASSPIKSTKKNYDRTSNENRMYLLTG